MAIVAEGSAIILRSFLHACFTAILYLFILQFFKVPKVHFALIAFVFFGIIEFVQYKYCTPDSLGKFTLIRDLVLTLLLLCGLGIILYFKNHLSTTNLKLILFVFTFCLVLLSYSMDRLYKPNDTNHFYKHFVDAIAYGSGPFLIYPFLHKYFF